MNKLVADVLVIGGGLSGLMATWQLQSAGVNTHLLEARNRIGGRILTIDAQAQCDLGPSWFWQGQPLIATLLHHFNIPFFEQHALGDVMVEQADGQLLQTAGPSPMSGSLRVEGGMGNLAQHIAQQIDPATLHLNFVANDVSLHEDNTIIVTAQIPDGTTKVRANRVAIAMPPRLAANLTFTPSLPPEARTKLQSTYAWMSSHAKFFAVYDSPFWREKGLCGSVISHKGPLAEIHDASPNSEKAFSLMGFYGIHASRRAELSEAELKALSLAQLVSIFGEAAGQPSAVYIQDWSQAPYTATKDDLQAIPTHPTYGFDLNLGTPWQDKVAFISTESSVGNGGLVEGALERGAQFATSITGKTVTLIDDSTLPHHASMDWGFWQ